jgi:hypothetical protein
VDVAGATINGASVFVRKHFPAEKNVRLLTHTGVDGGFKLYFLKVDTTFS